MGPPLCLPKNAWDNTERAAPCNWAFSAISHVPWSKTRQQRVGVGLAYDECSDEFNGESARHTHPDVDDGNDDDDDEEEEEEGDSGGGGGAG